MNEEIWNRFDRIFVVHYSEYGDRLEYIMGEMERTGMYGSGNVEIRVTYRNEFEQNLAKYLNVRACSLIGPLFIETKRIIAESIYKRYNRILIVEDDAAFLKDIRLMSDIVYNMPDDANIIQFEKRTDLKPNRIASWKRLLSDRRINDHYVLNDGSIFWGAACYAMNAEGMRDLDVVMSRDLINSDNCFSKCRKHAISIKNLCIQKSFSDSEKVKNGYNEDGYIKDLEAMGLNKEDYV